MNVVDSSGWLEYFAAGSNVRYFAPAIEDTKKLIIPVLCLYEVFKRVFQQRGENKAYEAIAIMQQGGNVVFLDMRLSIEAAKISIQSRLPMADSIILATAKSFQATLWTQDADFKGMEGVKFFARLG
ncbi:MAG: type II toxin-antitoxin system VapC family toxin [Candidatus Omnitrophica bacterium]|nr:type II toxin-antitoxin system VapC family toxin [Candidatus Omnitrophota bacterium]